MTKEELAAKLNGRVYGGEITVKEEGEANEARLVVVFGGSDDLMEFRGAIHDEVGADGGGSALLVGSELFNQDACEDNCKYFRAAFKDVKARGKYIYALWAKEIPYSWTFKTDIPHATFDILEDGQPFCRGIVFSLADVGASEATGATAMDRED